MYIVELASGAKYSVASPDVRQVKRLHTEYPITPHLDVNVKNFFFFNILKVFLINFAIKIMATINVCLYIGRVVGCRCRCDGPGVINK